MSSNIFGYQGVNTPLESLTNGRYSLADYTTLRETVDARLNTLEKQQATPENVVVNGSLSIVPNNIAGGYLTASGNGSFGGTLYAAANISTNAGLYVEQNAEINQTLTSNGTIFPMNGIEFPDGSTLTTAVNTSTPTIYIQALFYNQTLNQVITPASSTFKTTEINLQYNNNCTVDLTNLNCEDATAFPDGVRYITVTKANMADDILDDFNVTILCPQPNYLFYGANASDVSSLTLSVGMYGVTFTVFSYAAGSQKRTYIKSIVRATPIQVQAYAFSTIIIPQEYTDLVYYSTDQTLPLDSANFSFDNYVVGQRITILRSIQDLSSGLAFTYSTIPYRIFGKDGTVVTLNAIGQQYAITPTISGVQTIRSVWVVCPGGSGYNFSLFQVS